MSPWSFIRRGLAHYWRIHLAVALGVAVGTAVIAGALTVGDSLRGSLRAMTLERLAGVYEVVIAPGFFRQELADELQSAFGPAHRAGVEPLLMAPGTLEAPDQGRRASGVQLLGIAPESDRFGSIRLVLNRNEIALTAPLARELSVRAGDEILVRARGSAAIPAESALGRKTETTRSRRMKVAAIVEPRGAARFSLIPSQQAPKNAFLALPTLQSLVDEPGRANVLLIGQGGVPARDADPIARKLLRPTLDDFGLELQRERGYWQLTSRGLVLPEAVLEAADRVFADRERQPVFTYLANRLSIGERSIPYSTVSAIALPVERLPQLRTSDGQPLRRLADDEIALGAWAAEQLGAQLGDELTIEYFEPETTHGAAHETTARFRVAALLAEDDASTDPLWTPELPGVTDQLTIADWAPPFPFDSSRVRKADEDYWDRHRAAPKAFVSLAAGRKLWGSRFGDTTSLRIAEGAALDPLALAAALDPQRLGWQIRNVRAEQLRASSGTTPFEALFLGFSFFLIAAAVMLVALLARLGVERRAAEIGILLAAGVRRARLRRWLLAEAGIVAALGATLGIPLALGYARLMLWGLTTLWHSAVRTESLELYVAPASLALGWAAGLVVSLAAAAWAIGQVGAFEIRPLLAGRMTADVVGWQRRRRVGLAVGGLGALAALAAVAAGLLSRGEAQIGSFFAAGAATLAAALALTGQSSESREVRGFSLRRLARASAAARPARATLTAGMVAASVFLIAAIGAFRLDPAAAGAALDSGNGGFALVAESDLPIYQDLGQRAGREDLGFSREAEAALSGARIYALRVEPGDDASCLNLYQTARPRIVAVDEPFRRRGGWAWAATAAATPDERANPWLLLDQALPPVDGVPTIPVVVDQNTAYYSLHLWGLSQALTLVDGRGAPLRLQIVGFLKNSLLQGELIVGQRDLLRHFPEADGYRRFLVECPAERAEAVSAALERSLGDYGFDAESSAARLAEYFAVQNTYLTTFQGLGGLGLLLGTLGLAVVQIRNALERRGELALLRAVGLRSARTVGLVLWETASLLGRGVFCGLLGAAVALTPQWIGRAAGLPWQATLGALAAVTLAGLISGLVGARAALRADLLPALRGS